jgi:hypothetical protein
MSAEILPRRQKAPHESIATRSTNPAAPGLSILSSKSPRFRDDIGKTR